MWLAVEEVQLGKAAAPVGDNWVPVCRPEDLPKGEQLPLETCDRLFHQDMHNWPIQLQLRPGSGDAGWSTWLVHVWTGDACGPAELVNLAPSLAAMTSASSPWELTITSR